jgi:hypothetical protein
VATALAQPEPEPTPPLPLPPEPGPLPHLPWWWPWWRPLVIANDWYTYRQNNRRTGDQQQKSNLSDPAKVVNLKIIWSYPLAGSAGSFWASPIVVNNTVFIGSDNGIFYALDASSGTLKWQYPKNPCKPGRTLRERLTELCDQPLVAYFQNEPWGIRSSASYWNRTPHGAVIFGAPDPDVGYGSSRLFALDAMNGEMIWKSDVVAEFNGDVSGSITELHERRPSPAACPRLQSRQLSAHAGDAGADQRLVADDSQGKADQDWREDRVPRQMFQEILWLIAELRPKPPPSPA